MALATYTYENSTFLLVRMVICSNGAYVYTKLVYDQTARQMTTIMAQVQQLPGYEEGVTPVAFVGDFTDSLFAYSDPVFSRYGRATCIRSVPP